MMVDPDFEKMALLLAPNGSTNEKHLRNTRQAIYESLRTTYAAGLERAAEIADNDASVGNQEIRVKTAAWRIAKAIRAGKED